MDWIAVDSSNIERIAYNPPTKEMFIEFGHGGVYKYTRVSRRTFNSFKDASSKGEYFHSKIKGKFDYSKET